MTKCKLGLQCWTKDGIEDILCDKYIDAGDGLCKYSTNNRVKSPCGKDTCCGCGKFGSGCEFIEGGVKC